MKAIVAERGQITIPKIFRKKLGFKAGTVLDLQINNSTLTAVKAETTDVIEQVYGCLPKKINTNKFMENLRGKYDHSD